MKRLLAIFLIIGTAFLLSACGEGDGTSAEEEAELIRQDFKNFSIAIPGNWQRVSQEDFANTLPKETVALFLRRIAGDDFIQNVNVVKESLNTDASSLEYAKANLLLGSKALLDYRAVSTEETKIQGIDTVIHEFRARNVVTDPLRYYTQGYFALDRVGYTVTCIAKDEDLAQQELCRTLVSSFRFQL